MGMKSLKWEGIGTENLFPHTFTPVYESSFWTSKNVYETSHSHNERQLLDN